MSWRSCSISPARTWTLCGALADGAVADVAMNDEERAALRAEGLINPYGRLTAEGHQHALLTPEEVSFRMRQWKLHKGRS